jgi:Raf kinase inhibitor-like YbhB/YbcL family protein
MTSTVGDCRCGLRAALRLASPDIKPNGMIVDEYVFNGFGCSGKNISPALSWSGAPTGTKSFAVLVHDPDAPTGGAGWWHWLVVNIPANVTRTQEGRRQGRWLEPAARSRADHHRLRWLGRPLPTGGRQGAPLQLHRARAERREARSAQGGDRLARRLHGQRELDRQGDADRPIRPTEVASPLNVNHRPEHREGAPHSRPFRQSVRPDRPVWHPSGPPFSPTSR